MHPQAPGTSLRSAVTEVEAHVGRAGWEQPTRLFALVASDRIIRDEPDLAAELALAPGTLTSVEQEGFDAAAPLDELLAGIAWPDNVDGVAIALERIVLPPQAEAEIAELDEARLAAAAATHPARVDVRMVVGVMRDGAHDTVLRLRSAPEELIRGRSDEQLVPQLVDALRATLE